MNRGLSPSERLIPFEHSFSLFSFMMKTTAEIALQIELHMSELKVLAGEDSELNRTFGPAIINGTQELASAFRLSLRV